MKQERDWTESMTEIDRERERVQRETESSPPPSGTVRKVESAVNEIIVWPSGDFTIYGAEAWKLYSAVVNVSFSLRISSWKEPRPTDARKVKFRNMRHLLEHAEPCDDVRPMLEHALCVEAALMGNELDWPHFTCGPVALSRKTV